MLVRQEKFTPETLISAPRRSPGVPNSDGTLVIFSVSSYSFTTHKGSTELRLLEVKTGESRLLDDNKKSFDPAWLDTEIVALLRATDDETTDLIIGKVKDFKKSSYVAGTINGPAGNLKVVKLDNEHFGIAVSAPANPDGTIYCPKTAPKRYTSGRLYSSLFVRHWDTYVERHRNAIWYGALMTKDASGSSQRLTLLPMTNALGGTSLESPMPPFGGDDCFDVSRTGIIFVAKDPDLNPALNTKCNVYLIPLVNFLETTPDLFTLNMGNIQGAMTSPVFSRDGKKAAFLAMRQNGYEADKNQIFIMPDVTRPAWLIHKLNSSNGRGSWDRSPSSIAWSKDGSGLYLVAENTGRKLLYYLPAAQTLTGQMPAQLSKDHSITNFMPLESRSGDKVFFSSSSLIDSSTYSMLTFKPASRSTASGTIELISSATNSGERFGLSSSQVTDIWFKGAGSNKATNDKVHAWVIKPSGFDEETKYPLAFLVHGGPQSAWLDAWSTRWNPAVFAEQGYVVVCPNPTGSTGYGQAFCDAIKDNWGGTPYEDLVNCFNYLEDHVSYIDTTRAVGLGASYGGFMMNYIQGQPLGRKFKALVTHDGVFSTTYELATDELYFIHRDIGHWQPEKGSTWQKYDPSLRTQYWATPHLIVHSEKDYRLLIGDGLAAFNVLQQKGVESEFLTFPDENHFVTIHENSLVWHETVFNWINRHVGLPLYKESDENLVRQDPKRGFGEKRSMAEGIAVFESG